MYVTKQSLMPKIIFIPILFFFFAFKTQAQYYKSNRYKGGSPINDYNYSIKQHKTYSKGFGNSYTYDTYIHSDDYQYAMHYIQALYKTHSTDNSTDSLKQTQGKSAIVDRRTEFSENK
jgi:hypothetical protein